MNAPSRIVAIINAGAGGGGPDLAGIREALGAGGASVRIADVRDGPALEAAIKAALRESPQLIVAGGGDGTISTVAAALVDSDVALGVLPLGTLNHFAKTLRMPLDAVTAARAIRAGRVERVDVGEINGRIFLNNASIGLYPRLVRLRKKQHQQLGRSKWAAAAWAALSLLRRHALLRVRLTLDGTEQRRRTALVFIGNNAYAMNGLHIGERERLDGGRLGVYLPRRSGRLGLPLLALRALFGRLRRTEHFDATLAESVDVETRHTRLLVATDGEVQVMTTPLRFRIRPRALHVVMPPEDA